MSERGRPALPEASLAALAGLIEEAFPRARARWSPFLLLGAPEIDPEGSTPARIDLRTRTITLGARAILDHGLTGSMEALLAHEIGHLVAAPGSLAAAARLRLLERTFLPPERPSLTRPFYELLVDERLGSALAEDRRQILRAEDAGDAPRDPAMLLQRAALEELWQRPPGDFMGEEAEREFERAFPGYRADAQLLAQNLFVLAPSVPLQFLYFASIVSRYPPPPQEARCENAEGAGCMECEPSPDDWAEALVPQAAERAAIRRARAERWFTADIEDKLNDQGLEARAAAVPRKAGGSAELLTAVMAAHYRREAERWLFRPPPTSIQAEELVPTTLAEWDPGDPIASIDWVSTLLQRGETLGAAMPLLRERIADEEGRSAPAWEGRVEIYLDVSGSMPDPKRALNAMTLAAQILALGAVRAGGAARALVYSSGHEKLWTFCRSETILSRFLLHYIGQGTEFPFDVLEASVEQLAAEQPVRIVITDRDFDSNYDRRARNAAVFAEAAARSRALVLLLHTPDRARVARYEAAGARVVPVWRLGDFPRLSAELSFALFEQGGRALNSSAGADASVADPFARGGRDVVP